MEAFTANEVTTAIKSIAGTTGALQHYLEWNEEDQLKLLLALDVAFPESDLTTKVMVLLYGMEVGAAMKEENNG